MSQRKVKNLQSLRSYSETKHDIEFLQQNKVALIGAVYQFQ